MMRTLQPLLHLNSQEKWVIDNGHLACTAKQPGHLRNILDFIAVTRFASRQIQGHSREEAQEYVSRLLVKYTRIQQAIDRQNIITRLFVRLVLFVHGFHSHVDYLTRIAQALPSRPLMPAPTISPKGGFENGGNTCFIATALQCLNAMAEVFPKDIEGDISKKENESDGQFIQRKHLLKEIFALLDKSNRHELVSAEEMNRLRQAWHAYDPTIPPIGHPGGTLEMYTRLLGIMSYSPLRFYCKKPHSEKGMIYETDMLTMLCRNVQDSEKPFDKNYPSQDGICLVNDHELLLSGKNPPLFLSALCLRMFGKRCPVPLKIAFKNSDTTYELIMCGISGKGHAYCYAKGNDKEWINYDDHQNSLHSIAEIQSDIDTYGSLLIYRRQDK